MKAALIILGSTVFALACLFLIAAFFFSSAPPPAGRTGITPDAPATRGPDLGRGNPGELCATNRLGQKFTFNGVTYVCSGPKPYRWRAQD